MTITLPDTDYPRPALRPSGKPYYRKRLPYPTDELIQGLDNYALLEYMGVPGRFHGHAIAAYDKPLMPEIEAWVKKMRFIYRPHVPYQQENPDLYGTGLVLHGPSGSRKTTTASSLLLRLIRMGVPNTDPTGINFSWHGWCMGRFVDWQSVSSLFRDAVRDEEADARAQEIRTAMRPGGPMERQANFLVIDDISRERRTEFNVGELHRTLRQRHNEGYPTIITTNAHPDVWEEMYGEVLAAFLERAFIDIEFERSTA